MMGRWFSGSDSQGTEQKGLKVAPYQRIYAVGDIHGRHDLLNQMVEVIARDIIEAQDQREPQIIFLGDYVDRGDHSREVLDILMNMRDDMPEGRICLLKGNHEAAVLEFLADPIKGARWLRFGGLQTLASYGVSPPISVPEGEALVDLAHDLRMAMGDHVAFLQSLLPYKRSGDVLFVHAGMDPARRIEDQGEGAILWGQSDFIEQGGVEGLLVVHGHYDAADAVVTPRRICLDTGAYYSGRLTAMRFDHEETLLVADVMDQAPSFPG